MTKTKEISQFLKSKGFKQKSINSYCFVLKRIFMYLGERFTGPQVEELFTKLNLKPRTYNQYRTIVNFYTKKYLGYDLQFTKAKVDKSLPTYVSKDEFNLVLKQIPNIKHKLGLCLIYGSGLRSHELVRLKKHNIYYDKLIIFIKQGKGGKDRQTIIHSKIVDWLERFAKNTKQDNPYLFQTYRGHISERSFQEVLKRAIKKAGLQKHFTLHDLRHSFAINLVNKGIDLEVVRQLLGHSSLRTTQIYLQCRTLNLTELALKLER